MGFVFVHSADWHIGRAYRSFGEGLAAALDAARLDAITMLGGVAERAGARHVLVAGDVFDSPKVAQRTLLQAIERMGRHAGVTWWLLPGNHDPARDGGVWSRFAALDQPGNIVVLPDAAPREIEAGVWLLPAPLAARTSSTDPTAWMGDAATPAGALRIGLAHGSVKSYGSAGSANVPIDPKRAQASRLDYLALGDWHGTICVDARTWYSGTPEPDSFDDNGPGNALLVTVPGPGETPVVERIATAQFNWRALTAPVTSTADLDAIDRQIDAASVAPERLIVKLALAGRIDTALEAMMARWLERLDARLRHFEADLTGLVVSASGSDLAALDADPVLSGLVVRLRDIRATDPAREQAATTALRKLVELGGRYLEAAE